jgi:molybdenum cofactor guanylyltransferase
MLISAPGCSLSAGRAVSLLALCAFRSLTCPADPAGVSHLALQSTSQGAYSIKHVRKQQSFRNEPLKGGIKMTAAVILTEINESKPLSKNDKSAVVSLISELQPYFKEIIVVSDQPAVYLPYVKDSARILTPFYKGMDPLYSLHAALSLAISDGVWVLHEAFPFPGINTFKEIKTLKENSNSQCAVYDKKNPSLLYSIFDKSVLPVLDEAINTNSNRITDFFNHIDCTYFPLQKKKSLQT